MIPQQASLVYLHQLTSYEKREIEDYPIVYTVGDYGSKNQTNHELGIFTLPNGSYCFKEGDHISYRYSIDEVLSSGYYAQVSCVQKLGQLWTKLGLAKLYIVFPQVLPACNLI